MREEAFIVNGSAEDLERWAAFLETHDVNWVTDKTDREIVSTAMTAGPSQSTNLITIRLIGKANDLLKASKDPRRVLRESTNKTTLRILTPERRKELENQGMRFEAGFESALLSLATIPITLGVYFGAHHALVAFGFSSSLAFGAALIAYVLTVRLVRGRWPLQPA